jgi:hypothetical protein
MRIPPAEGLAIPVPPPSAERVPVTDGVNVCTFPLEVIVIAAVKPFVTVVDVAKVCVAPVCACPAAPSDVTAETR